MPAEERDPREKELIPMAASVGAGCRPCTVRHVRAARDAGACEPAIRQAVPAAPSATAR